MARQTRTYFLNEPGKYGGRSSRDVEMSRLWVSYQRSRRCFLPSVESMRFVHSSVHALICFFAVLLVPLFLKVSAATRTNVDGYG
jgi:hypothetical protein